MDVYRIGVSIALTNGVSSVLKVIQRDVFGLGKQVDLLSGKFSSMKLAALGAMGAIAGGAMLYGLGKLVEAGAQVQNQQQLMLAAGISNKQVAEATAAAWKTTATVMGTGIVDNLKAVQDLRIAFSSAAAGGNVANATTDAIKYLPMLQTAKMIIQAQLGANSGDQVYDYAKSLEMIGATQDPKRFTALLNEMVQAALASGGRVSGSGFFSAFKYGRAAAQGWDNSFIGNILPLLIQEMGGGSGSGGPGNALMSAYSTVVAGKMSNRSAEMFAKLNLLNSGSIIYTTTGDVKGVRAGGIKGSDLFSNDPYQWVQKVLMPALTAAGVKDPNQIRQDIAYLFGNRTASQIIDIMATQQARFQGSAAENNSAQGLSGWGNLINQNLISNWNAFTQALVGTPDNPGGLVAALGMPMVPAATRVLHDLTVKINEFTIWVATHQSIVLLTEQVLGGLAIALTALGVAATGGAIAMMIGAGGTLAAVVAGLGALAAVLITLKAGMQAFENAFPSLFPSQNHAHMHLVTTGGRFGSSYYAPDAGYQQVGGQVVPIPLPPSRPAVATTHGHGNVYLDGHKVGKVLGHHLSKPRTGSSTANYRAVSSGSAANAAR